MTTGHILFCKELLRFNTMSLCPDLCTSESGLSPPEIFQELILWGLVSCCGPTCVLSAKNRDIQGFDPRRLSSSKWQGSTGQRESPHLSIRDS